MTISKGWEVWAKGAIKALVGGTYNGAAAVLVAPDTFNWHEGLHKLLTMIGVGGVLAVWNYFQVSPLPLKAKGEVDPYPIQK